jgi:glutathione S-transferase
LTSSVQDDDGFVLFESRSIARYVAQKAGSSLVPSGDDLRALALYDQAQNVEAFEFSPPTGGLYWELYCKPEYLGIEPDEKNVEEHKVSLARKLAGYERILGKTRYLTGDEVSLVDLFHIVYGASLATFGIDFLENEKAFPSVSRYATAYVAFQLLSDQIVTDGGRI